MMRQFQKGDLTWRVTPDLLGVVDSSGVFRETNPAWFAALGRPPEDIESRPFFDFIHPDDLPKTAAAFEEIQTGKPILGFTNRYRHADGSYRWLSWNAVPDGELFFCSARDVTEEKENAAALNTREAEARFREQFIAVLGHDLRNPLAAIQSGARLLQREGQTDQALHILGMMDQSVARMSDLISDVMDFTRARLGSGIEVDVQSAVDIGPLLNQTVDEIRMGNPEVLIEENYKIDRQISCDPKRLSQMVSNLLGNSVNHGDTAHPIVVNAQTTDGCLTLSIANGGEQIPDSARAMLFEPFTRADLREAQEGLGLGLFIAREIANRHGGELTMTSDQHQTIFEFQMPLKPA